MDSFLKKIQQLEKFILEILFPSVCLGCHIKGEILCQDCINKIPRAERDLNMEIHSIFYYHDPLIKKAIWDLKYHNRSYLGQKLGKILYEEMLEEISDIEMYTKGQPIIVIPVPTSKKKTRARGYNQAYKIALGFCESGGKKLFNLNNNIIKKVVETIPQARINNRERRLKNIKGAFSLENKEMVYSRVVIIIDDVTTTGGTIKEIMNLLKKSGAKKVLGITVAH